MKLHWENETHGDRSQHYVLKRQTPTIRPFLPPHTHDHAELIYVEKGSCLHQVNGVNSRVTKGDVLFIYPETVEHCYHEYEKTFSILQILFPQASFWFIKNRYATCLDGILGEQVKNPLVNLGPMQQIWFERNFDRLLADDASLINIEHFLLNFIWLIKESNNSHPGAVTSWLEQALRDIQEPENFSKGHQGFIDLCNHSAEHVERQTKLLTGRTVTEVVNHARTAWAAYVLAYSDTSIMDIAFGCGLESVSHFYKIFHDQFGVSPAKYRKQAERTPVSFGDRLFMPF